MKRKDGENTVAAKMNGPEEVCKSQENVCMKQKEMK